MYIRFLVLFLLFSVSVVGQESELLIRYRGMALEYNPDVRAAEKSILLNKELESSARADMKPKLSAGANLNYTGNPMELSLELPVPVTFSGRHANYGASVSLAQPIYSGGRVREAVKMAQKENNLAFHQSQSIKADVCYETDFRYWNTVARGELAVISRDFRASMQDLVRVVRERVEAELVDRNDLLMAEVKLNEAEYQYTQAQHSFEVGRMALNSFLGLELSAATPIDSGVIALTTLGDFATEVHSAVTNRPEMRVAEDRIAIQESALKLNDARFRPQFHVGVEGNYTAPGYDFKSDFDPNYLAYAKLSVPLFEWGKRRKEKQASKYKIDIAKDNYNKVKDYVNLEVQSAFSAYRQAVNQVVLTGSSLEKAMENERLAMDKYKEGSISILEVIDAQIYLLRAQQNNVQSRMNAQVQRSAFVRALGNALL